MRVEWESEILSVGGRRPAAELINSPSYGVPLTPFRTASQCKRSSSFTGPRWSKASFGDLV
jgi:hypothetical protein